MDNATGLKPKEQKVVDALVDAWENYKLLPATDDEKRVFDDGIHKLQRLLAVRVVRREYPYGWTQKQ